ncbi:MAG: endonuclease III [Blastocatellia bacterium]|nr:endonuclease III [Blastocatellia bacterium]
MTQTVDTKKRAGTIVRRLRKHFPKPECALVHESAFELLVATILSAQCTDERVNKVTANLFRKYRKPADYLNVDVEELGRDIYQTGFYRNKAKNIQGACRLMVEEFGGEVPKTIEELLRLPGVARKTANVVLGTAFGIASGVVVDTHVGRLARRMALTQEEDPVKVERDLCALVPRKDWIDLSHMLILHGRATCSARAPQCETCFLNDVCPAAERGGDVKPVAKRTARVR